MTENDFLSTIISKRIIKTVNLLAAIAAYERQREAVEGWATFIHALQKQGERAA